MTKPVSLIFIDGARDYDSVKADLRRVIEGGIIAFHDCSWCAGPRRYVRLGLFRNPQISGASFVRSIAYGRKTTQPSGTAREFLPTVREIFPRRLEHLTAKPVKKILFPLLGKPVNP